MSDDTQTVTMEEAGEITPTKESGTHQGLIATGGILGAIAASSCCILPLALTVAGVSGAWMANLRSLAPYQPVFIILAVVFIGYGFYLAYWTPKQAVADGSVCARPIVPNKVVTGALWSATFVVALAFSFPYWFPLIVPYLP
jgi:mercuric ion transport protein